MTKASAFGKIILFGEHAVVYGRPALAVPVTQVHADVDVSDSRDEGIWIDSAAVRLHAELKTLPSNHPIAAAINNLFFLFRISEPCPNLTVKITSTIPVASGLGSGAAVTVALTRALASHLRRAMKDEDVNAFTFEIEKIHHGVPSGIDNTVITYAKPVYFSIGKAIETFKVGQPFTFVIADTGIPALTNESAEAVRRLWLNNPTRLEKTFDQIGDVAFSARCAIEAGMYEWLGELMNKNHALLQELSVSSPELDRLVEAARGSGALGAKLSGGGRGGNIIALVKSEMAETVSLVLKTMGARNIITTPIF
ncbi:MAG TPA: mevalonate kinase [Anaerolineales bacterium]|nr:mevalonate kinase [Anaerolineales bacterium]